MRERHSIKPCQSILGAGSSRLSTKTSPALKIEAAGFRDGERRLITGR
jgi:hypothetical protein